MNPMRILPVIDDKDEAIKGQGAESESAAYYEDLYGTAFGWR